MRKLRSTPWRRESNQTAFGKPGTVQLQPLKVQSLRQTRHGLLQAKQLLLEAIERDANNSLAHSVLGALRRIQNRRDEARIEFETAIALDRNNAHALLGLGQTLTYLGRPAEATR